MELQENDLMSNENISNMQILIINKKNNSALFVMKLVSSSNQSNGPKKNKIVYAPEDNDWEI